MRLSVSAMVHGKDASARLRTEGTESSGPSMVIACKLRSLGVSSSVEWVVPRFPEFVIL